MMNLVLIDANKLAPNLKRLEFFFEIRHYNKIILDVGVSSDF